jgi:hypothetical protein
MFNLFKDSAGKTCLAKICYTATLGTFLYLISTGKCTAIDYTGMAMLLGVVAGTYYGRSDTKSKTKTEGK